MADMTLEQKRAVAMARARLRLKQQQVSPESTPDTRMDAARGQIDDMLAGLSPEAVSDDMNRIAGGIVRGMRDVPDAGAQLLTRGLEAGAGAVAPGSSFEAWARGQRENVEGINTEAEREYQEEWRGGDTGFDAPRLVGNVAGAAPIAYAMPGAMAPTLGGRIASGVATGSTAAALQPVSEGGDFWEQKAIQTGAGAVAGGALPVVTGMAARLISPKSSPQVQALRQRGVTPTPGQTLGGAAKAAEEKLSSVPILGDVIKAGQRRTIDDFNRSIYDDIARPAGIHAPKTVGRDAVRQLGDDLGKAYDDIAVNTSLRGDKQFAGELANLNKMVMDGLPEQQQKTWTKFITDKLARSFGPNGKMDGRSFLELKSALGKEARSFGKSTDTYQQKLGDAFGELLESLRGVHVRANQGVMVNGVDAGKRLAQIDTAYAKLVRLEKAAGMQGAAEGVITPAQLSSAVKAMDQSTRKRAFARGGALMQDVADTAKSTIGNTYPDSGTAGRGLAAALLGGGAYINPYAAAGAAVPMMAYTPMGQKLAASLMAGRQGPGYKATAAGLRRLAPALAAGGGIAAGSSR